MQRFGAWEWEHSRGEQAHLWLGRLDMPLVVQGEALLLERGSCPWGSSRPRPGAPSGVWVPGYRYRGDGLLWGVVPQQEGAGGQGRAMFLT